MAFRLDRGTLRSPKPLSGGRIRVDAALTRSGVFEYRNPDGTIRREYRPPEEVNHPASIDSLRDVPFTDDHPPEGEVTAENARRRAVGHLGESVSFDGEHVIGSIVVNDAAVIAKMRKGKREVSCGYHCDTDDTPGVTPDGKPYDLIQRNIRYNHVALVDVGRAGPHARVRMDAAVMINTEERRMDPDTVKMIGEIAELKTRLSQVEKERDAAVLRADRAEGERDTERTRADSAEKARNDAAAGTGELVRKRVELISQAQPILGTDVDLTAKPDGEIKRAVIAARKVELRADASDAYVDGVYDTVIKAAAGARAQLADVRPSAAPVTRADEGEDIEAKARAKQLQSSRDAYKTTDPRMK